MRSIYIIELLQMFFVIITITIYILGYKQITKNKTINRTEKFLWFLVVLFFNFVGLLLLNIYLRSIDSRKYNKKNKVSL
jgi:hypothetical protein